MRHMRQALFEEEKEEDLLVLFAIAEEMETERTQVACLTTRYDQS